MPQISKTELDLLRLARIDNAMRAVDDADWYYIDKNLGDGGQARFWKAVLSDLRIALKTMKEIK